MQAASSPLPPIALPDFFAMTILQHGSDACSQGKQAQGAPCQGFPAQDAPAQVTPAQVTPAQAMTALRRRPSRLPLPVRLLAQALDYPHLRGTQWTIARFKAQQLIRSNPNEVIVLMAQHKASPSWTRKVRACPISRLFRKEITYVVSDQ